jgi:glycerol-3-phosphate dehydrogenase (NAD(P)+)
LTTSGGPPIAVIGAGSWGTALAIQFARSGRETRLWGRDDAHRAAMASARVNEKYLPGAAFPDQLRIADDLKAAVTDLEDVLIAVPSHALRETLESVGRFLGPDDRVAWATKGFELETGKLPHQVALDVLGSGRHMAVLSGPTFATEVGAGLPTAMTVASSEPDFALEMARSLTCENFRAYTSTDILGVEVGGAVKNVLAIGAGMSDGLGFGANTRIALITRGLVEMTRLGVKLGARAETFMGLALAAGKSITEAKQEIRQVVEGVLAAKAVRHVAMANAVEMPISQQIYRILYEGVSPKEAVVALMSREVGPEIAL